VQPGPPGQRPGRSWGRVDLLMRTVESDDRHTKWRAPSSDACVIDGFQRSREKGRRISAALMVELPGIEPATKSRFTCENAEFDDAKQRETT
jgi:hypothetical protein